MGYTSFSGETIKVLFSNVWNKTRRVILLALAIILTAGPVLILNQTVSAAQITTRSVAISSAVVSATNVTYTFTFNLATAGALVGMTIQGCNTPVGACSSGTNYPTGLNIKGGTASLPGAGWQGTVSALAQNTVLNNDIDCTQNTNLCLTWTDATSQNTTTAHQVQVTGVTNPSGTASTCTNTITTNCSFYFRIVTYSAAGLTSPVDSGNVAASTTANFTVNATVAEQLTFCVGADSGTLTSSASVAIPACATLSGTSLNLGTLSTVGTNVSPVPAAVYNGDGNNAVAELTTNAFNGSTISVSAVQAGSGSPSGTLGTMRVTGAACPSDPSYTDQCINSANSSGNSIPIAAGTEDFGMAVPGIDCANTPALAGYTCNATHHNLTVATNFECAAADLVGGSGSFHTLDAGGQDGGTTACNYFWDQSGTYDTVASSSSGNVVPGEALIIVYAATPSLTTPTGSYSVSSNYMAAPVF